MALGVEVRGVPTVRDADGLALSSRNAYLSADERQRALALPRALERREAIVGGEPVGAVLDGAKRKLSEAGFGRIDYVRAGRRGDARAAGGSAGGDALDRRGDHRNHPADRQYPCRFGHSSEIRSPRC